MPPLSEKVSEIDVLSDSTLLPSLLLHKLLGRRLRRHFLEGISVGRILLAIGGILGGVDGGLSFFRLDLLLALFMALDLLESALLAQLREQSSVEDTAIAQLDKVLGLRLAEGNMVGNEDPGSAGSELTVQALLKDVAPNVGIDCGKMSSMTRIPARE